VKLIRSWPSHPPEGRARVDDSIERLFNNNHDYRVLGDVDDDVLLLEWDIAVGRDELVRFAQRAQENPDRVIVAPYPIYRSTLSLRDLGEFVWPMRRYNPGEQGMRHVHQGESHCHLFALGMTYLPAAIVKAFLADYDGHFSDGSFSGWHYRNVEREVPIAWDCAAVHLNYALPEL
jgi:hypothetical protein